MFLIVVVVIVVVTVVIVVVMAVVVCIVVCVWSLGVFAVLLLTLVFRLSCTGGLRER